MEQCSMFLIDSFRQKKRVIMNPASSPFGFTIGCDCCDDCDPGPPHKSIILATTPSAHGDSRPRVGHPVPEKTLTPQNLCWDDGWVMCAATTGWTVTCNSGEMKPQQCSSWNNQEIKKQTEFGGVLGTHGLGCHLHVWTWVKAESKKNEPSNRSPKN